MEVALGITYSKNRWRKQRVSQGLFYLGKVQCSQGEAATLLLFAFSTEWRG